MKLIIDTNINEFLQMARKRQNLTQTDVAKQLGLSAMGLSYLENGSREIKVSVLEKWAKLLGYKVVLKLEEEVPEN